MRGFCTRQRRGFLYGSLRRGPTSCSLQRAVVPSSPPRRKPALSPPRDPRRAALNESRRFPRLGASSGCHASVIAALAVPHRLGDAGSSLARPCSTSAPSSCHQPSILACQPMIRASANLCGSGRPHPSAERRDEALNYCSHAHRQGDSRGIQRGTFARKASYSAPNLGCSVRSSYRVTYAWQASQNSAA